jgi:hypothetical protein
MVAYSFKARFAPPIIAGTKRQTIRADRRRHARPGEEVQLYTGMRTKSCRLIGRATCDSVVPIRLDFMGWGAIEVGGHVGLTGAHHLDGFARDDGFESWEELKQFWSVAHPVAYAAGAFSGVRVRWKDFRPA